MSTRQAATSTNIPPDLSQDMVQRKHGNYSPSKIHTLDRSRHWAALRDIIKICRPRACGCPRHIHTPMSELAEPRFFKSQYSLPPYIAVSQSPLHYSIQVLYPLM
ncbi:hypothetical protein H0G86_008960 [Trichoderma simmonsii]|uniref:Uncharacterized protein n=1 Tax=Trichoderma simmonsii TaxID=1491479 RepID=A0A8G0LLU2_9HYPO|nr:hypothetical protein H0G86_008960 [Trichoderma simmonsii]